MSIRLASGKESEQPERTQINQRKGSSKNRFSNDRLGLFGYSTFGLLANAHLRLPFLSSKTV